MLGAKADAGLDYQDQVVVIYDRNLKLISCTGNFGGFLGIPETLCVAGTPAAELLRFKAERGEYGAGDVDELVRKRLDILEDPANRAVERRVRPNNSVVEIRHARLADGAVVSTYIDVTARERSVGALAASEMRLRTMLDSIVEGVITTDNRGIVKSFNPAAEGIFGYSAEQIIGKHVAILAPKRDRGKYDVYSRRFSGIGRPRIIDNGREVTGRRRDGTELPLQIGVTLLSLADERLFVATVQDISERQTTDSLSRRHAAMMAQMSEAITVTDVNHKVIDCNPAVEELYGYSRAEVIGKTPFFLHTDPDHWQRRAPEIVKAIERLGRWVGEVEMRRKDGTRFAGELVLAPFADDGGKQVGIVGVIRDVSERKSAQEKLYQAQAQLYQAQKMEAVGQLTGGVAHDFNNLLTVVMGNLELLEEALEGDDRHRRLAERAVAAAHRGATLVQRLLAFSRQQLLAPEAINVNSVVSGMLDLLDRTIGKGIGIHTRLEDRLWPAVVDAGQLENALLNLVINARDAMPDGGSLTIETANICIDELSAAERSGFTAGDYVQLTVGDTGSGMTPEVMERVFEPFFTTKGDGKGSGLGLSMVYGFIRQSDGQVMIDSEVGEGSTVSLYLPRSLTAEPCQSQIPMRTTH